MVIEVGEKVGWQFGPGALRYLLAEGEEFGFEGASGKGGRLWNLRGFSLRRGFRGCAISGRGDRWRARHRFSLARPGAGLVRASYGPDYAAQTSGRVRFPALARVRARDAGCFRCAALRGSPRQGLFANEFLQMPIFLDNSGNLFGSAFCFPIGIVNQFAFGLFSRSAGT